MSTIKVGHYILERLSQLGVRKVYGVPGDFNLGFLDYIEDHPTIDWVGCCNELNASYAADGYARIKQNQVAKEEVEKHDEGEGEGRLKGRVYGLGVLLTTFGVGELSCVNGVAGAFSEHIPLLHIAGTPAAKLQAKHAILHHTLGDGRFDAYQKVSENVTAFQAYLTTPDTAGEKIDECIKKALIYSRPTYMTLPTDIVNKEISAAPLKTPLFPYVTTEHKSLNPSGEEVDEKLQDFVVNKIIEMWTSAKNPALLMDACGVRHGVSHLTKDLIEVTKVRWFTSPMGKTGLDETDEEFAGVYLGDNSIPEVKAEFDKSDFVITVGTIKSDFNSGAFSWRLPIEHTVELHSDHVEIAYGKYPGVSFHSILPVLISHFRANPPASPSPILYSSILHKIPTKITYSASSPITHDVFWPLWSEEFFKEGDIVLGETGTSLFGLFDIKFPKNSTFVGQVLWGSIGWTGGAVLGCAEAAEESKTKRRTIQFIGDGSIQLTVQEISTLIREGLKPIIVVLENKGYTIERYIHGWERKYNDIQPWDWKSLLQVFTPKEYSFKKATTVGELKGILADPDFASCNKIQLLEVVMDQFDAPRALKAQTSKSAEVNEY